MNALDAYVGDNLESTLKDLVYLRASLINGCTYCVDAHSVDLQAGGVPQRKVFSVTTWRESDWFTPRERAALALTEQLTLVSLQGVTDEVWSAAGEVFDERELADLVLAISAINVWNRIAISTLMKPPAL